MDVYLLSAFVFSGLIGLSLGLIGGGGSIITLPVLVYLAGIDPLLAVGMSLAVVGATSLVGVVFHYLRGNVDLRKGALFGGFGAGGAYFGSGLTPLVSGENLLLIFALLLAAVALVMMFRKGPPRMKGSGATDLKKTAAAGLLVGLLTGFLGVGGGFLIVPALVLFGGVEIGAAIGTSLLVIAINSAAGLIGQFQHHPLDLKVTAVYGVIACTGTWIGARLGEGASPERLQKGFAWFAMAVALFLIFKSQGAIIR